MNPSDYRRQYAAFCSASESERYNFHAGLKSAPQFEPLFERHADLWTREAVEDLRTALRENPAQFETERAGLRALVVAAESGHVEASAREVSEELARCAASARVEWAGERLSAEEVRERIENETDAARRRELAARWLDASLACDDLRAARFEVLRESARALGLKDSFSLREGGASAEFERLAAGAEGFLRRTASFYETHLARWLAHVLPPPLAAARPFADALFFRNMAQTEALLSGRRVRAVYDAAMSGLGIRTETQRNIRVDDAARPSKKTRPRCFGLDVPDEVALVFDPQKGERGLFREFFHQAGVAQLFAWSSRETARKYPEFVYAPDAATREGYGLLFEGLFRDAAWVAEHFGLRPSEASEVRRAFALADLYDARRACAGLRYCLALREARDVRAESLAESYASLYTEATGFRYPAASSLLDAEEAGRAGERLRASLFAVALEQYMRGRHGRRWWSSRRAGDELIDMWNTSSRYSVEELSRLMGCGELEFERLADELEEALKAE